ncbi:MAG TPA: 50S ribosomal protein L30 [Gammaproteobacteria bacterium]|jgi:large subunit ribosomal protein L30|nr:50S ribosomal protein L30 [Gammaproteobacteria bacterium]HAE72817.1 50S ribosomal protein L30 [Gammaproteobacteria bacterium]HAO38697.1 50S ribosomal protein L30 [Gammaproteobacteria bacterium]HAO53686.1 50S ribosomal protein L30 [Gammaproteobacteria bacterium]HAO70875.1 50S ribosomal protein L30 [Gammaproteobacteria bacterium]
MAEEKKVVKKATAKKAVAKKPVAKKAVAAKKAPAKAAATKAVAKKPAVKKAAAKKNTVSVTLVKSFHGRLPTHRATITGLGLKRINHTVVLQDTPEVRGMINKVSYLLKVEG